ncbi:MAG: FKBP-type peptidyl-prolyl cis-trans isomerase [Gemmatimonadetes bacterium]|nr:FKBP-type peptidyl-prolyl cis-trans isomerase [Gemmatimonadota bacterium]
MTARHARLGAWLILVLAATACASGGESAVADLTPDADGFMTTGSGLRYKVVQEGTGPKPTSRDRVLVHYSTRLANGTVIDSSYDRGEPDVLTMRELIRGFREALELMSPGSHFEVIVPGRLGYGWSGLGDGLVGPNETLYFQIQLFRIEER